MGETDRKVSAAAGAAGTGRAAAHGMAGWRLRVRFAAADGWDHEAGCDQDRAPSGDFARMLGLEVACEEKGGALAWHVDARPEVPVRVTSIEAVLRVDLAGTDALYLDGYNSWTDSVERRPDDATPGFGVPRAVIDHWVLDGSGDYRFTKQDGRRGHQHGFEYGYLRRGDGVGLVGSLGWDSGFTTIYEDLASSTLTLSKEPPARTLAAGEHVELFSFCWTWGALDEAVGRWLALAGVRPRQCRPLVGYSSWYRHYTDISEDGLEHDLAGVSAELARVEAPGCEKLFQIDDGYTKVGDWLAPDGKKFPRGLAPLAREIAGAGLIPGIWIAPFVCERQSSLYREHPDWLLRGADDAPVRTGSHWSGQVALDTRNPEVRAYVRKVLSTYTRDWGFRLLKCDFLYGACMLSHDGMNRGELMADALDLILESVAPGTLLDFCGVPLVSAFGRAHYCRVGCDVGLDWDANWLMRRTGRERVSTKNSLANTLGRAHLDGRAFRSDPDVFFLRRDVKLDDGQRERLLETDARSGGMLLTSDDMGLWDEDQRAAYRAALATFAARAEKE